MSQQLKPQSDDVPPAKAPVPEHRSLHEIYFPKHLHVIIRRERARADRQRGCFSLVMFRLLPVRSRWATLRLSRIVMNEVRTTDEVGLYDRHTVCAILPDTAPEGAWKLISRVRELAGSRAMHVEPVIYTYPSDTDYDDRPGCDSGHESGTQSERRPGDAGMRLTEDKAPNTSAFSTLPLEALLVRRPPMIKRAIDVAIAGAVVFAAMPCMLAIAALIKYTSDGPIVFRQWRCGLGGRPFQIYKFRTMCVDADKLKSGLRDQSEQDGPAFKMTNDPRVTLVGKFLRKTSLDELPQLLNVLKGDMSLVGPRPLPLDEQAQCDQWHRGRLDVMPGLTCVWQVKGRSRVSFEDWMRMDLSYIRRYQILHDLKLMLMTIPAVILRRGAK